MALKIAYIHQIVTFLSYYVVVLDASDYNLPRDDEFDENELSSIHPSFPYLSATYSDWHYSNEEAAADNPVDDYTHFEEKISLLEKGLKNYLDNADVAQEELIKLNAKVAQTLMINDALLITLDQNPNIKTVADLVEESNSVMRLMKRKNPPKIDEKTAGKLFDLVRETVKNKSLESTKNLQKTIEGWIIKQDIVFESADTYEVQLFQRSRQEQTADLNRYQSELHQALNILNVTNKNPQLVHLIDKRLDEVETFRAGISKDLPKQSEELSKHLTITDVAENYRSLRGKQHPSITATANMGRKLKQLTDIAANPIYHKEVPGVRLKESGIKSWMRTVDKLIYEKSGNWSRMSDLSRINPIFSNVNSMFLHNKLLYKLAPKMGWKVNDDVGPVKMYQSGCMNWKIVMKRVEGPANGFQAEVKLDGRHIAKSEFISHPFYELAREIGAEREANEELAKTEIYRQNLSHRVEHTADRLLSSRISLPEILQDTLEEAKNIGKEFIDDPKKIAPLYNSLTNIEAQIRFCSLDALASPSMKALSKKAFEKMIDKNFGEAEKENNARSKPLLDKKQKLETLFNNSISRHKSTAEQDNATKQYEHIEGLIDEWKKWSGKDAAKDGPKR